MALIPIRRQPVLLKPFEEEDFSCGRVSSYCSLYKAGEDAIYLQVRQTPCDDSIICNPNFASAGTNLITNGGFAANLSGWVSTPAGWIWSAGTAVLAGSSAVLGQTVSGMMPGYSYLVTITITTYVAGSISLQLGAGTIGALYTAAGTYTEILTPVTSGTIQVIGTSFNGAIDNVTVQAMASCWEIAGDWTVGDGRVCHSPGTTGVVQQDLSSGYIGKYMQVPYSVFGMTEGSVVVSIGGTTLRTVTSNGDYTDYAFMGSGSTYFTFTPDSDFDGCIAAGEVNVLLSAADSLANSATLVDNDGVIQTLTIFPIEITINKDRVNYRLLTAQLNDGCYRMIVYDPCAVNFAAGLEINDDVGFDTAGLWTMQATNGETGVVSGSMLTLTTGGTIPSTLYAIQVQPFPNGNTTYAVHIEVEVGNMSNPTAEALYIRFPSADGSALGAPVYIIGENDDMFDNTTYTVDAIVTISNGVAGAYTNKFALYHVSNSSPASTTEILSLSVKIKTPVNEDGSFFTSNCLQVLADTGNAQLVRGLSDQSSDLGFEFNSGFPHLQSRLHLSFTKPRHPNEGGKYLYSTGRKKKTWGIVDWIWDLVYHKVDVNMHSVINAMHNSDNFYIGPAEATLREYFVDEGDYTPDYGPKGEATEAESVVEISLAEDTQFNT